MRSHLVRVGLILCAVPVSYVATISVALAQAGDAEAQSADAMQAGRVEFDHPGGGEPAVQFDLPAGLWSDVVGIGDAAVAGVVEGLLQNHASDGAPLADVKLAADQLAAIRTILAALQDAVGEVRVRVYHSDDESAAPVNAQAIAQHYSEKLADSKWAKVVQVRDNDEGATVFVMHGDGAVRGVFVVAGEDRELVLVNVLCDVSPERVKQVTQQATSLGVQILGEEGLHELLRELQPR